MIKVFFRFDDDPRDTERSVDVVAEFFMEARRIASNCFAKPIWIIRCERS